MTASAKTGNGTATLEIQLVSLAQDRPAQGQPTTLALGMPASAVPAMIPTVWSSNKVKRADFQTFSKLCSEVPPAAGVPARQPALGEVFASEVRTLRSP
jgi:hypothetical protein